MVAGKVLVKVRPPAETVCIKHLFPSSRCRDKCHHRSGQHSQQKLFEKSARSMHLVDEQADERRPCRVTERYSESGYTEYWRKSSLSQAACVRMAKPT